MSSTDRFMGKVAVVTGGGSGIGRAGGPVSCHPLGCRTGLGDRVVPTLFVNIETVVKDKVRMVLAHESQMDWLQQTQSMSSLEEVVMAESRAVGKLSGTFSSAEAFTPHDKRGYCPEDFTPLEEALSGNISFKPQP